MPHNSQPHGNQDDHHDAHVNHLRLVLGSILSPKRTSYTRTSATTSGTASPAMHHPHTVPASPELPARSVPACAGYPATPRTPMSRSNSDSPAHPSTPMHLPEAVAASHYAHAAPPPVTSLPDSYHHEQEHDGPGARQAKADFIKTLQSKRAWDALIHGSFV